MKWTTKDIAFAGIYLALIAIMGFTPYIGFIPISGVSIALILLPIAIVSIHYGWRGAMIGIWTFGLVSFIAGFYIEASSQAIIDTYGAGNWFLIAFGSRFCVAVVVALIALVIRKLPLYARMLITVLSLVIVNTVFYLLFLQLFAEGSFTVIFTTVWINIVVEWTVIPFITMAFYPFLKHFVRK